MDGGGDQYLHTPRRDQDVVVLVEEILDLLGLFVPDNLENLACVLGEDVDHL